MVAVGEERQPHVGEDKVLCKEVDEFKYIFCSSPRLIRQVDVGIVGLGDTTEKNCNNTCRARENKAVLEQMLLSIEAQLCTLYVCTAVLQCSTTFVLNL